MSDFKENNQDPVEMIEPVVPNGQAIEEPSSPQKKKQARLAELVDMVEILVITVGVVLLLFSFVFRLCTVLGDSMEDTLYDREVLLVSNLFYSPESGDIVVFHQTGTLNEPVVKRIIATEGETVSIRHYLTSMRVTVTDVNGNTQVLEEEYCKYEGFPYYTENYDITVPEGHVFVLGDNRNNSKDSRHSDIGLVDERRILGKVLFRIAPLSRFGAID